MSDLRKAAQQALEALEAGPDVDPIFAGETEEALRDALAQQPDPVWVKGELPPRYIARSPIQPEPVQEPVAWMYPDDYAGILKHQSRAEVFQKAWCNPAVCVPLYTAPPQRPLLTDEEIAEAVQEADLDWQAGWTLDEHEPNRFTTLARAIERKVRGEAE